MSGKRDDILERQGLVFIQYRSNYLGTVKETERIRLSTSLGNLWVNTGISVGNPQV